jgi:hypothetical protein
MNCLRLLKHWGHGFESHSRHGCLSVCVYIVFVLSYVGSGLAMRADLPSKESYGLCKKIKKLKKQPRPNKGL